MATLNINEVTFDNCIRDINNFYHAKDLTIYELREEIVHLKEEKKGLEESLKVVTSEFTKTKRDGLDIEDSYNFLKKMNVDFASEIDNLKFERDDLKQDLSISERNANRVYKYNCELNAKYMKDFGDV